MQQQRREELVNDKIELVESMSKGRITDEQVAEIQRQALFKLRQQDPILGLTLDIKVVCNPRRNFLNLTIRRDYITLCHSDHFEGDGIYFCYFVSDKLEPFVIVSAINPELGGKLKELTHKQATEYLPKSLENFRRRFGITNETYHYTQSAERKESDAFAHTSGAPIGSKGHSSNWHLKIRVATDMVTHLLPVFAFINLSQLRHQLEPVKYNFSRETLPWSEVHTQIISDSI